MALRRVFVDLVAGGEAFVEGPRAHHLARVVRLREGEELELSDGQRLYRARAGKTDARRVDFTIEEELPTPEPEPELVLQVAVFQFPRFEWAIEKATELGATRILPVAAERSETHLVNTVPKRLERWRRIAEQAAQQSRRMSAPVVDDAVSLEEALGDSAGTRLVLHPDGRPLREIVASAVETPVQLLVGPEGGWTDDEVSAAIDSGYQQAGMGPLILRCETAAIAALAIVGASLRG